MRFETWERIQKAIDRIRSGKLDELAPGRHELFDGAYVNIFEYQTKAEGLFEAHRKYIDIHYLIRGCETIRIADVNEIHVEKEYDEEGDCLLGLAEGKPYLMREGDYMVVLPEEAHLPGLAVGTPESVKKAVLKVLI